MTSTSADHGLGRVTDIHVHVQPWEQLKPAVRETMERGKDVAWLLPIMQDPAKLLALMDGYGIWRVGLVNYPSPDLMGFDASTNDFIARYAAHDPVRLLPIGGVHPRFCPDPAAEVDRLVGLGIRCLKIHPPHQLFAANAYTDGMTALAEIYARAEHHRLPVMIHTGTSIFPGARCKYGHPMELDDVAIDFPQLPIVMAHGGRPLWTAEAFFVLRRHANVWLDLSGIPPRRLTEWFPRLAEIGDRVLWGTDWPSPGVRDMRANLDQFVAAGLAPDLQRKICVDNPLRLFPASPDAGSGDDR